MKLVQKGTTQARGTTKTEMIRSDIDELGSVTEQRSALTKPKAEIHRRSGTADQRKEKKGKDTVEGRVGKWNKRGRERETEINIQ